VRLQDPSILKVSIRALIKSQIANLVQGYDNLCHIIAIMLKIRQEGPVTLRIKLLLSQ